MLLTLQTVAQINVDIFIVYVVASCFVVVMVLQVLTSLRVIEMQRRVLCRVFQSGAVVWVAHWCYLYFLNAIVIIILLGAVPLGTLLRVVLLYVAFQRLLFFASRHYYFFFLSHSLLVQLGVGFIFFLPIFFILILDRAHPSFPFL